jgi:AcrR family transcriptional regulator
MARTVDEARHRAKRQHILHAAAGLFAAQGYDGTSTAAICRAAETSPGNLYHYFSSKREIFAAVVTDDDNQTAEQLTAALANDDPWAGLLDFVDHLATPAAEPVVPNLVLEAMLQAYRDPELAQLLERDAQDEQAGIVALLTRAAEAGLIDPGLDAEHTASWVMTIVGVLYLRAALDESFDPAEQMPTLRLLLERFLRHEPD